MAAGPADAVGVEVRALRKSFGDGPPLFDGLDLVVEPGESVALLGSSGVGKSTLIRIVAGLDRDVGGTVRIGGIPPAEAAMPGFVFQDPRLLPWLTAAENIRLAAPAITDGGIAALLARMGLDGQGGLLPGELSGGMQRRVALARALAVEPRLLLLDEPFVSLDRRLVRELHALVAGIVAERRLTSILVSHEPEDAARLATRAIRLEGRPARIVMDRRIDLAPGARDPVEVRRLADELDREAGG
ncbi:ABC transporter ATP-binding protein [Wenxinia marina]|uniref:ABC-type nitrate/sulfonate/bicarbonate transport system, ATPase component n=1 Tax=Wenxinia marina DSM 24838 TaxID=1123501 RepID=A0A0D0Q3D8_9RHOB|nr:ABC transporter ATP-binding protein [Wenxinia marina]KIQ69059.1 ABC-type nitrate/sulfonate/bicarbonate transport system, ATPase component [Wenxinia marina DSM 24838]GGL70035.1 ABC transporter ATP-binding protein [Wenxinia marina]